jgi:hypothetical protein
MFSRRNYNWVRLFSISCQIGIVFILATLTGCNIDTPFFEADESSGQISVYNYDQEYSYWVHLYLVSDDTLIASKELEKYQTDGYTNSFTDIDTDYYYLTIVKADATKESGRSGNFHVDADENLCFMIEDDGDIKNCN